MFNVHIQGKLLQRTPVKGTGTGLGHYGKKDLLKRGSPLLPPHGVLLPISSKGSFICTIPQDSTYYGFWYTSRGALAGTRKKQKKKRYQVQPKTSKWLDISYVLPGFLAHLLQLITKSIFTYHLEFSLKLHSFITV